jgi:hypothetical protein
VCASAREGKLDILRGLEFGLKKAIDRAIFIGGMRRWRRHGVFEGTG